MRANRAFELLVTRGGREPAFLADPRRRDRLEVVSIDTGEVVLFWDLPAKRAAKLARALRADLAALEASDFIATWSAGDADGGQGDADGGQGDADGGQGDADGAHAQADKSRDDGEGQASVA